MSTIIETKDLASMLPGRQLRVVHKGMADWAISEGEEKDDGTRYNVSIIPTSESVRISAAKAPADPGKSEEVAPGMEMLFEINQGVPCLHIANMAWGDPTISIFLTERGIIVRHEYFSSEPKELTEEDRKQLRDPEAVAKDCVIYR